MPEDIAARQGWQADAVTTLSAKGTRLNRRGLETRSTLLRVAVRCLAEGGPDAVSANLVAKEAGVTWGTVQHQFGDSDGLWAAMLESISERGTTLIPVPADVATLGERVTTVIETIWNALERPTVRAMYTLRSALPPDSGDLEAEYPRTAAALRDWDRRWEAACREAFEGVDVDPVRLHRVRSLLPGTVRGLHDEQRLSPFADIDGARLGLAEALTAYLSAGTGDARGSS
jgi:AcrR family transcriptional regulator